MVNGLEYISLESQGFINSNKETEEIILKESQTITANFD